MAYHSRVYSKRIATVVYVDIRTAYTGMFNFYNNFIIIFDYWFVQFYNIQLSWFFYLYCFILCLSFLLLFCPVLQYSVFLVFLLVLLSFMTLLFIRIILEGTMTVKVRMQQ